MVAKKNDTNAKMQVGFITLQLLNKFSYKVPVAQVLKEIERFSNPVQLGISSSICLEDVCIYELNLYFCICVILCFATVIIKIRFTDVPTE